MKKEDYIKISVALQLSGGKAEILQETMYRYYRKVSGYLLIQNIMKGPKKSIC